MDRREIRSLGLVVLAISVIYLSQINESLYMHPQLSREDGSVFNRPQYYNTATSSSITRNIDDEDDEEDSGEEDEDNNDDETSQPNTKPQKRKRPYFVLHVGPPKTATTTIQHGFKQNRQALARDDNVVYLGSLPGQNNRNRMIQYEDPRNNHTQTPIITFPMSEFFPRPTEIFSRTVQYHAEHSNHVVLSAEHYTSRFPAVAKILHTFYDLVFLQKGDNPIIPLAPEEAMERYREQERKKVSFKVPKQKDDSHLDVWTKDTSDQFAFDVKIVTSYRHYWEWLPSFYYQWELFNKMAAKKYKYVLTLREFIESALDKLPPKYFVENDDDDDDDDTRWDHEVFANLTNTHGTLFSYLKWSEPAALRNRVELFDLHHQQFGIGNDNQEEQIEQRGLFTNLLCQSIPAPITCDSRWNNATKVKEKRVRVKTTAKSAIETGILSDMLIRQLIIRAKESFPELGKSPKASKGGKSQKAVKSVYSDKFDPKQNVLWLPFGGPPLANKNIGPMEMNFYVWATKHRNKDDDNPPVLCLDQTGLDRLRLASWNMLLHLHHLDSQSTHDHYVPDRTNNNNMPKYPLLFAPFVRSVSNGNIHNIPSPEDWKRLRKAHDDAFWESANNGKYCELDLDRLFDDDDFVGTVFYSREYETLDEETKLQIVHKPAR